MPTPLAIPAAISLSAAAKGQLAYTPPPPLPSPPTVEHLLFEQPIPLSIALLLLAALAFEVFKRRGRPRAAIAGAIALAALAAVPWFLSELVPTARKDVMARARDLVQAAARADLSALDALLADDARFRSGYGRPVPASGLLKPAILAAVEKNLGGRWAITEHSIQELQTTLDSPATARTQLRVRVVPETTGFPHTSWWMVEWRRDAGGRWRAAVIEPVEIPGAREAR